MENNSIIISMDKTRLDIPLIYNFLTNSYWAKGRTKEQVIKSIENSNCFGMYDDDKQIGFARVITDYSTFGYIADVFIVPDYRGNGLSKQLMADILSNEQFADVKSWYLITKDAQGLYRQFDFREFNYPEKVVMHLTT